MRLADLNHDELLKLDPDRGIIHFAGQRALLLDAVAMGILRKYLVENFGVTAARAVLTQFGFAHGWRMAEAMQKSFNWASKEEWSRAGTHIHSLQGLFRLPPDSSGPLGEAGVTLDASYEAEQHLLHFGRFDAPICWTIAGLTSGYLSRSAGEEIFVLEDRCTGKGDAACHLVGRTREAWGDEREGDLRYFDAGHLADCLDVSLQRVTTSLKKAERKLREAHRAIIRVTREEDDDPLGIVSKSAAMREVVALARRVAKVDTTVFITGESGTGKERLARLVHDESARATGPFVAVNCGAIAETLLESELFGHARGAFTGATHDRPGLFEAANGGTLLLDEVGEISPGMQVKLLRVLQEREVRRVGENTTRRVNVRVISATNRDLLAGVASGTIRQDLFYRLKVVELHLPPLRERLEDILPLARVLLGESAVRMGRELTGLSPPVADQLLRYGWPGNIRELANVMERAAALAQSARVELADLPEEVRGALPRPAAFGSVRPLDDIEREYILAALKLNDGNQARTAEQLQIGTATLYRKLKLYGHLRDRGGDGEPASEPE